MTEKTMIQIQNIKSNYNIGVEVEMNHITRRNAAMVAANFFGTGHYENTAYCDGYMTWSAWDALGRKWKFSRDVSIKGPDDEKTEMVTPILEYDDIPMLQELLRRLRKNGAISNPQQGCGVHIHVSRKDGFSVQNVKNLVNIMASHEEQIGRAIFIDQYRTNSYCRTVEPEFLNLMHKRNPKTMDQLEKIWYKGNDAEYGTSQHYNDSRYHMLNLHSFFNGHGTIEFRLFQFSNPHTDNKGNFLRGGIHAGKMKAYIQLCIAMCELATQVKYASPKPQQTENEKYAMRCWMLRLGFIGEEFKTAREVLLRNMDGNSAFRKEKEVA